MPTYEYECAACGKGFELFQPITAHPVRKCVHCGALRARRLISAGAGIIFRGSGFYETDYRSESYKAGEKKEKEAAKPAKSPDSAEKSKKSEKSSDGAKSADSSGGEKKGGKKKDPA